jgi:hypothetical protein
MPHKANEARRHKIPKARYRIENWPVYDMPHCETAAI